MLKFVVADQCTKRHNKNSQPTCLDVFDKNLHALLWGGGRIGFGREGRGQIEADCGVPPAVKSC